MVFLTVFGICPPFARRHIATLLWCCRAASLLQTRLAVSHRTQRRSPCAPLRSRPVRNHATACGTCTAYSPPAPPANASLLHTPLSRRFPTAYTEATRDSIQGAVAAAAGALDVLPQTIQPLGAHHDCAPALFPLFIRLPRADYAHGCCRLSLRMRVVCCAHMCVPHRHAHVPHSV